MPTPIIFHGDLSTSQVSDPFILTPGTRNIDIDIAWPATGEPRGALTIEECIHGDTTTSWQPYKPDGVNTLSVAVAGTADVAYIRGVEIAGPKSCRLRYTRSSGGTGAHFNDGSSDATRAPLAILTY